MKAIQLAAAALLAASQMQAQPSAFESVGIGGGGALFSPAINPSNDGDIYFASDLGGLYHTADGCTSYDVVHFTEAITGPFSKVCFTENSLRRYAILYDRSHFDDRPARSDDGGKTWSWLPGDDQPDESKLFIFSDLHNGGRLVWTDYNHLFFSKDGGQTATQALVAEDPGTGILLSGALFDGQQIFLGTNYGIYQSTDGGTSFSKMATTGIDFSNEAIMGFGAAKEPTSGSLTFFALTGAKADIYASSMGFNYYQTIRGVYKMENADGVWAPKMTGIDLTKDWAVWLGMAENDPTTCYIAGGDPSGFPFVMRTEDGGNSWQHTLFTQNNQNVATGYAGAGGDLGWTWGGNALGFAVSQTNPQHLLFTDYGFIHRSLDGGTTWHQAYLKKQDENPLGTADIPNGKAYRGIGMEQTTVWDMAFFDKNTLFGCFTDIRGVRSTDGGKSWAMDYTGTVLNTTYKIVKAGEGWFSATSSVHDLFQTTYVADNRVFPSYKDGLVLFTNDKGKTWQTLRDFNTPVVWLAADPSNSDRMYVSVLSTDAAEDGLWRVDGISTNPLSNAVWKHLPSPVGVNAGRLFNVRILKDGTIAETWCAKKSNSGSTFSPGSGVWVSTDDGQNWADRSVAQMKYWTKDLVVDPFDAAENTWYACVWSGWGGPANDLGRLWRTTDRGLNWQPMTADGQFLRVSSVTVDPLNAQTMYLTTEDQGLWVTHNKSAVSPTWELVAAYPFWHPERVVFNPFEPKQMWVCSFGNGMRTGQELVIGTGEAAGELSVRLMENPVSERIDLQIVGWKTGSLRLEIFDATGRLATAREMGEPASDGRFSVPLDGLADGFYFGKISASGERTGGFKFLKK